MSKYKKVMSPYEILEAMRKDKAVRRTIVRRSQKFFFHFYFPHYIEYPIAPFHEELFHLTETDNHSMMVVSAFRNSGKSTLLTMSYVIWAIISGRAKYILIVSENQQKAKTLLNHIKEEMTSNDMLKFDLGPFQEEQFGWNSVSLTIKNYNAKITAVSTEQSVRGLRHVNHRPDLIVVDDAESQDSVRTEESRDKLSQWLSGDVIPAGHSHTKVIIIGSILHPDSLIPRLQKQIDLGKINGIYRMYPIVDEAGNPLWPGKYPDQEAIEREKARGITDREWSIEYMLKPILDEYQIIKEKDIHYYDREPQEQDGVYRYTATAVDPAISTLATADFTAMVSGKITRDDSAWKLYILPSVINERLAGPELQDRIVAESMRYGNGTPSQMYIENVSFQKFLIDLIKLKGIPVGEFSPGSTDKRARLISVSELIKKGLVLFPREGADKLIKQLLWFGAEKHDDMVDALVMLISKTIEQEEFHQIVMPRISPVVIPTRQESEKSADERLRLYQEAIRSGDPTAWRKFHDYDNECKRKESEAAIHDEELAIYNRLMRRCF